MAEGELAFSDEVARSVLNAMVADPQPKPTSMARLSERERQISFMVARGMKNRDIASELTISENTVKRHLQSIFSKTGAHDRLELAVLALSRSQQSRLKKAAEFNFPVNYFPALAAIFLIMASTSLRSLSFKLGE